MQVKIGEKLTITSNDQVMGKKGIISVKNCTEFPSSLLGKMAFFDMGSICATIKSVEREAIECEIQNEGHIYENSQVTFSVSSTRPPRLPD
jgi:pyruvate kinase